MPDRILIVQLADIGDLVVSTPALAALRDAQPGAHIALLTSTHAAPVIETTGLVDEIIGFDKKTFNSSTAIFKLANLRHILALRKGRYDTVIFLHHFTLKLGTLKFALIAFASRARRRIGLQNGNGWFLTESIPDGGWGDRHQAQYWLDLVHLAGADSSARPLHVNLSEEKTPLPDPAQSAPRIALHSGSGGYSLARRWDTEKFAIVADALHAEYGAQIILTGRPEDDTAQVSAALKAPHIDLTGKTSLAQLSALLATCDLFIGADSGVMHLAAAAGTPVIAIFGPSNHHAWGPWTPDGKSVIVRSGAECSPCSYIDHGIGLREGCLARTCMRLVTAQQVIDAARHILSGAPVSAPAKDPQLRDTERIHILGLPVDAITYETWLAQIGVWINHNRANSPDERRARHVCTTNPEFMMVAQDDVNFRNILRRADLCVPDGVGLLWAARRLGHSLPERVTGSDGVPRIAERAARAGWRLYLLGAAPGVAEKAAEVLQARFPGLQIAGTRSGSPALEEEDALVAYVNASGADILFVAYGAPQQDKWIARNLPRLNVSMAMGVGGAFDFIAGIVPRAPVWMREAGLEWLFRLYLQPWRMRRMLRLPRFVWAVLRQGRKST